MQWLVEEGVFDLPTASADPRGWKFAWEAAASSPDGVAKLQWLQERGGPPLDGDLRFVAALATFAGQVEAVQHLLAAYGPAAVLPTGPNGGKPDIAAQAVASGSVPMSECLRQAGFVFGPTAYPHATMFARLATVRWLALEAGVSASGLSGMELYYTVKTWPNNAAADSRDLLEAVQLLVGAGFCSWGEEQEEEDEEEAQGEEGVQAWGEGDVFAAAVGRGDLTLAQYLLQLLPRPEKRLR